MSAFFESYDRWENEALEEFRNSEYWEDDYETGHLEISEDGSVYLGGFHWIKNVVTPWQSSKYFVE